MFNSTLKRLSRPGCECICLSCFIREGRRFAGPVWRQNHTATAAEAGIGQLNLFASLYILIYDYANIGAAGKPDRALEIDPSVQGSTEVVDGRTTVSGKDEHSEKPPHTSRSKPRVTSKRAKVKTVN